MNLILDTLLKNLHGTICPWPSIFLLHQSMQCPHTNLFNGTQGFIWANNFEGDAGEKLYKWST